MEKRVLLAVILSFLVLYGYQALFPPPKPQPRGAEVAPSATPPPPGRSSAAQAPSSTQSTTAAGPQPGTLGMPQPQAEAPSALVADVNDRDVVVENGAVRASFSSRGGVLKSWRLKQYADEAGRPLELVPQAVPPGTPRPFSLRFDDPAVMSRLDTALFKPSADSVQVTTPATLVFEYRDASGLDARKVFSFSPEHPYVIGFSATISRGDAAVVPTVQWGPALGSGVVASTRTYNPPPQPIFFRDGKVVRVKPTKIQEYASQDGIFGFAGADDHYFLTAAVAPGRPLHVEYQPLTVQLPRAQEDKDNAHFVAWAVRPAGAPSDLRFFAGPKDFDVLVSVDRDLVRAIDFGMFSWLVVPLLRALKWINGYIGNYGWSIIALTVLINLAMFPLRHKSVVSMRKMQELQPEVKAIQDRYAKLKMSDPARQKMNVEMMNLYRERGVNPASGCVPMLLTLPVLFAFYSMLSVAIELRGAPFVGWIKDLSVHDPLFITPVLMGVTQFIQTRMTPQTGGDPVQQKMMMFMPLIFMTMFIWAPSGLVLYWTVSNLWAIGQQLVTNRLIGAPAQRAVRPPAERRLKNAGAGKSEQASKERK
jgi:YidC/Oxa1 family membrane protein insertase